MDALTHTLADPGMTALLWGSYSRLLGLVFAIALLSFVPQLVPLAGRRGITPVEKVLTAAKRDFGDAAYWWWPTLFWISHSDFALVALPLAGGFAGLYACLVGGQWGPTALRCAWMVLLSIDAGPNSMVYPWDSLLLEAGFLAPFLPATSASSVAAIMNGNVQGLWLTVQATAVPAAVLQWSHRWLLFRVLIGFGKLKFMGSGWNDRLYIKAFILTQPMITPAGLLAHRILPDAAWIFLLAGMFVVELILPWALLVSSGFWRFAAAMGIANLMVGIQLTGNFGYFNLLSAVLSIPCMALGPGTSITWSLADVFPAAFVEAGLLTDALAKHDGVRVVQAVLKLVWGYPSELAFFLLLVTVLIPGGALQFVMNSWINLGWPYWPVVARLRGDNILLDTAIVAPARMYTAFLRAILQWRVINAYGVFPPQVSPPQRWACVYETSNDGVAWTRLEYRYYLSSPYTPPRFVAPYHPRLDHAVFYESLGMNGNSMMGSLGHYSPYAFPSSTTAWSRLQVRLLLGACDGKAEIEVPDNGMGRVARWALRMVGLEHLTAGFPVSFFFTNSLLPAFPPRFVRMLACHYTPLPEATLDPVTGRMRYWNERVMSTHLPKLSLDMVQRADGAGGVWSLNRSVPEGPDQFWCESVHWVRRAVAVGLISHAFKRYDSCSYPAVWNFIKEVRRNAERVNAEFSAVVASQAILGAPPSAGKSKRRSGSLANTTSSSGSAGAAKFAPERSSSSPALQCAIDAAMASFVVLPSVSDSSAPNNLFRWDRLQHVFAGLLTNPPLTPTPKKVGDVPKGTLVPGPLLKSQDLAELREQCSSQLFPIFLACDRVFGSAPPPKSVLLAELGWLGRRSHGYVMKYNDNDEEVFRDDTWPALYMQLGDMIEGTPPDASARSGKEAGLPLDTPDGRPVHYFAGNDDAHLKGCMANPMRWSSFVHWVALVGGQDRVEEILRGLRVATGLSLDPPLSVLCAALGKAPRVALFSALFGERLRVEPVLSPLHPGRCPTEAGTFIPFLLNYTTVVAHAANSYRLMSQSPPVRERQYPGAMPSFLPALLPLVPRLAAHESLRRMPSEGLVDGKVVFTDAPSVPRWAFDESAGMWVQLE